MRAILVTTLALLLAYGGGATMTHAEDEELPNFDRLWDYRKPDETEKRFRELLPKAEASGNLDYHLQLLTQLARTQGLQKKFDEAHAILDQVEQKLTNDVPIAKVRYLLERGRAFNSSKHPDKARVLFLEAWDLSRQVKSDRFAVDAAHMMGIVEPPEKQLAWSEKALAIVEKSEDKRLKGWLGALYNNIGWSYFELKRYEDALDMHRKGLAWRESIKQQGVPVLIARWAVARMLRALERYDEALKIQREVLEARKAIGEEGGYVYEEIGELLLATGKAEEAKPYFVKAWELLKGEDWLKNDEPERYARLRKLAGADEEDAKEGGGAAE